MNKPLREQLYDRVRGRVNDMMAAAKVNVYKRVAINNLVLPGFCHVPLTETLRLGIVSKA